MSKDRVFVKFDDWNALDKRDLVKIISLNFLGEIGQKLLVIANVTYPALKCGASPVPPAFMADGFIREFRAGSPQPHPIGLFIRWATHCPSLPPHGDIIGNIPIFSKDLKYLKLPFAYPHFEKQGFASNDFIKIAKREGEKNNDS